MQLLNAVSASVVGHREGRYMNATSFVSSSLPYTMVFSVLRAACQGGLTQSSAQTGGKCAFTASHWLKVVRPACIACYAVEIRSTLGCWEASAYESMSSVRVNLTRNGR